VSLAETRSFSRSAQLRHVTQPAFSRRIQALEAWAGTALVDRSAHPTRLTPAGQTLYAQSLDILQALQSARAMLRGQAGAADVIDFAVPHALAFAFFPDWLSRLRDSFGPVRSRLSALNTHDAVTRLVEGGCDLLMVYHHASQPLPLDTDRFEWVRLGQETLAPYCAPDVQGRPLCPFPGDVEHPLPYLGYAPGTYLGRIAELVIQQAGATLHLERVYETDLAEGLKGMALQGQGVAFLPSGAAEPPLRTGRLVPVAGASDQARLSIPLDIRIYREKPTGGEGVSGRPSQALWAYLVSG
jgi:DNA-binding transcriptional LysR family regulator